MWEISNSTFSLGVFSVVKSIAENRKEKLYNLLDLALSKKTDSICILYSNHEEIQDYCISRGHLFKKITPDPIEIDPNAYTSAIKTTLRELNGLIIFNDNSFNYKKIQGLALQFNVPCKYIKI